jgi:hypothetical protein
MPYSLNAIYQKFRGEVNQLNQIIANLSVTPKSIERDTHIEGCFIRFVVSWEYFCEEYYLRCMCNAKTRSQNVIKPHNSNFRNVNEAFKRINNHRRDREKDYLDWLDGAIVKQRIDDYFRSNSRVQKIVESPDRLFEIRVVRNAIAHRSKAASSKFEKYVKDQLGYLSSLNPSTADLLLMSRRGSTILIFHIMSEYFIGLADRLTK